MPAPRMGRLGGLRNPAALKRPRGPANRQPGKAARQKTPCCSNPEIEIIDGNLTCKNCYTAISDDNIVSEVTFEESNGGRATVQGGTVGENSRFAKTLGPGAHRRGIGGERNSFADIQNAGKRALQNLCPKLGINNNVTIQAEAIWTLAANINFSAGRRTDEVVSACLYAACRRQKDNEVLLMDIAELVKINVFRLGEVYKDLCKTLYLREESLGHQYLQELEPLIKKYCDKLQFADKTRVVAEDALKIIKRMNRDWIVDGRHPAGLCGACIILAARMNNFRRSVREVVYVSKIADATIAKRIMEFRRTKSAGLTVEDFRKYANRIVHQHDPPAILESQLSKERMEKRRRNREDHRQSVARESQARQSQPVEIPDDETDASSRLSSLEPNPDNEAPEASPPQQFVIPPTPPMSQPQISSQPLTQSAAHTDQQQATPPSSHISAKRQHPEPDETGDSRKRQRTATPGTVVETMAASPQLPQLDADGFAIPALPAQTTAEPRRRRGRPKKEQAETPYVISQEELAEEDYLEKQIAAALEASEVQECSDQVEAKKREEIERNAKVVADEQRQLEAHKLRTQRDATGTSDYWQSSTSEFPTAEELEKEFENDPEVMNCELSAEEVRIKEQIWVTHNEDWLRRQAEKEMLAKVAKATGKDKKGKKGGKDGKRKKRSKMGDGSVLTETSTPIETPADAARAMLEKRAPMKSQFVDFSMLQRIYGRDTPSRASSSTPESSSEQTRNDTPAVSRDASVAPSESAVGGAESPAEEADEEEGEEEAVIEPATWDNMQEGDPEPDDDDDDPDSETERMPLEGDEFAISSIGLGLSNRRVPVEDEFGAVDYGFEGEDYEGYD